MREMKIQLKNIEEVKRFVSLITAFSGAFDLISGRYIIDAKSILGIFSVDLSKPLTLRIDSTDEMQQIQDTLQDYIV